MWTCPYCGGYEGIIFQDQNLKGMLCMGSECGRFDQLDESELGKVETYRQNMESPV